MEGNAHVNLKHWQCQKRGPNISYIRCAMVITCWAHMFAQNTKKRSKRIVIFQWQGLLSMFINNKPKRRVFVIVILCYFLIWKCKATNSMLSDQMHWDFSEQRGSQGLLNTNNLKWNCTQVSENYIIVPPNSNANP